jgi:hypothetical protein
MRHRSFSATVHEQKRQYTRRVSAANDRLRNRRGTPELGTMAFAVKLVGVPHDAHDHVWSVDNVVWPIPFIQGDTRFRRVVLNTAYVDYAAILSVQEALEINEKYLDWGKAEHWTKKNREVQELLLKHAEQTSLVVVRMYEWESGLD